MPEQLDLAGRVAWQLGHVDAAERGDAGLACDVHLHLDGRLRTVDLAEDDVASLGAAGRVAARLKLLLSLIQTR